MGRRYQVAANDGLHCGSWVASRGNQRCTCKRSRTSWEVKPKDSAVRLHEQQGRIRKFKFKGENVGGVKSEA